LLRAGVTSFVDLTVEGELSGYEQLLPRGSDDAVHYRRLSIVDHSVPGSPQSMALVLDAIGAELADGRCVYVHCRAGIGRTGTTVGCHLIRTGMTANDALDRLQVLWQQCARSRSWPSIPETEEQIKFVLGWHEGSAGREISIGARCEGALSGLAVGEALGILCAGGRYDSNTIAQSIEDDALVLEAGVHAAMTTDVAESLFANQGQNAVDQMQRYLQSSRVLASAAWSTDFKRALAAWQWSRKPNTGSHDPANLDAHSLPRSLAAALYRRDSVADAIDLSAAISRTTQQSPVVLDACRLWTAVLFDALAGADGAEASGWRHGAALGFVRARKLRKELDVVLAVSESADASQKQDAVSVVVAALAAFEASKDFMSGMLIVIGASGDATATVAALYGSLAGAYYGVESIPAAWRRALPQQRELAVLARRFAE
jgi:ADP-ribosylglycohydrolase